MLPLGLARKMRPCNPPTEASARSAEVMARLFRKARAEPKAATEDPVDCRGLLAATATPVPRAGVACRASAWFRGEVARRWEAAFAMPDRAVAAAASVNPAVPPRPARARVPPGRPGASAARVPSAATSATPVAPALAVPAFASARARSAATACASHVGRPAACAVQATAARARPVVTTTNAFPRRTPAPRAPGLVSPAGALVVAAPVSLAAQAPATTL
jgi:hypothetical protein